MPHAPGDRGINARASEPDPVLLLNRFVVGTFFAISGHHKLFIKERHAQLVSTLEACGIPHVWFCQWFVPIVEFLGGLAGVYPVR